MIENGYYVLESHIQLVGYDLLPFGLYNSKTRNTNFINKELFDIAYSCDGETYIEPASFSDEQQKFFRFLLESGFIKRTEDGRVIGKNQRYKRYRNYYKKMAHWSITGDCNYRCKHCFMSAPDAKFGHPTFDQILSIISQMEACGIRETDLTGGEPLIREDFYDILDALCEHNITVTSILTNGALVSEKLLDELEKRNMHPGFQMSFDGVGYHDWMRGITGAEKKVLDAFKLLKKRGYSTASSMALFRDSVDSVRESVNLLAEVGCSFLKINAAAMEGEWINHPEMFLSYEESLQIMLDYLPHYFEDGMPLDIMVASGAFTYNRAKKICYVRGDVRDNPKYKDCAICGPLRHMVYISPDGTVLPCQSMMSSPIYNDYPNIFESSLQKILSDSKYIKDTYALVGDFISHNKECQTCEYAVKCRGGCRAVAIGATGIDYLAIDEETCLFFKNGWYEKYRNIVKEFAPGDVQVFNPEDNIIC